MTQYFYKVKDAADLLGISRTSAYELVKTGEIRGVRIAGAIRVPATAIEEFVSSVTTAA